MGLKIYEIPNSDTTALEKVSEAISESNSDGTKRIITMEENPALSSYETREPTTKEKAYHATLPVNVESDQEKLIKYAKAQGWI